MAQKMPVINEKFREMAFQSPNVRFLTDGLAWVKDSRDDGGKVFYLGDNMMRLEQVYGKLFQIKPFVRRAFNGSVVKVEPIDVNGSSHLPMPHKKAGAAEATPRPRSKPWG